MPVNEVAAKEPARLLRKVLRSMPCLLQRTRRAIPVLDEKRVARIVAQGNFRSGTVARAPSWHRGPGPIRGLPAPAFRVPCGLRACRPAPAPPRRERLAA